MAVTPAMGIRVILVSPSEDSFEKGNQSLDFPHFSTFVHTLAKPRNFARNQDDLPRTYTDAFYEQVGPKRQQIRVILVYFAFCFF